MDAIYQADVDRFGQRVADSLFAVESNNWGFLLAGKGISAQVWLVLELGKEEELRHVVGVNRRLGAVLSAAGEHQAYNVAAGIPQVCIKHFAPSTLEIRSVKLQRKVDVGGQLEIPVLRGIHPVRVNAV